MSSLTMMIMILIMRMVTVKPMGINAFRVLKSTVFKYGSDIIFFRYVHEIYMICIYRGSD